MTIMCVAAANLRCRAFLIIKVIIDKFVMTSIIALSIS